MRCAKAFLLLMMAARAGSWLPVGMARAEQRLAESQPSMDVPAEPRPDPFRLDVADLYLGMRSDYEYRRVRSSSPSRRDSTYKDSALRLDETMGLATTGYVYDPNLLDFHAAADFGLTQARYRETVDYWRRSEDDSGLLMHYDLALDAFKTKPVSVHAYARRVEDRLPRQFLPSLHQLETEAGASALILTGAITTEVGYSFRDTDLHGNRLDEDDERIRTNRFYLDSKWDISDSHHLHLSYDHEREMDAYQGSLYSYHTSRDEFRLDHDLAFGNGHRVDTYVRVDSEKGDFARDETEIVPRLTLQHNDKLKTIWRYGFYQHDQSSIKVDQHKFDGEALYTPNKDWRFSLDGYGLYEHVDRDIETNEFGGLGEAGYRRSTGLGDFSADLNLGFDSAHTAGTAGRRYARAEAHTLGGVRPVFLRQLNVIMGTIIAHDDKYRRIYVFGVDYLVTIVRDRAVVNRIPTGRIAENDVVYFDYQYEVPAEATVETYRVDFRVEHAFPFGLTPYYYLETRTQEIDRSSMGSPVERDNQDRHRLGIRYGQKRWTVGTEYEIFDDSVLPYDAWHFTGQAAIFRARGHSLDLNGEVSFYNFDDSGSLYRGYDNRQWLYGYPWDETGYRRRVWYLDVDIRDRVEITDLLSLTTAAKFRREDDSVRGNTTGVDAQCGIRYTKGYLTVELDVEYDLLNIVENRDNGFAVYLNVKRDLTHLLPQKEEVVR